MIAATVRDFPSALHSSSEHNRANSRRSFHYAETAAQMLIVVAAVIVIDMVSARLRKGLV